MKIALIQLNYHVGNVEGNVAKIKNGIKEAKNMGADLAVFAELAICGYPPKDLLLQNGFVRRCEDAAAAIAKECRDIAAIVGGPSSNLAKNGRPVFNSAFFMADGKVKHIINKSLLPFYDVFDEYRYFEPWKDNEPIIYKGTKLAITICEDIWNECADANGRFNHRRFPLKEMNAGEADCIINISASPFSYIHYEERRKVTIATAKEFQTPLFYVNNIGSNTDLTFDGGSFAVDKNGNVIAELARFKEDMKLMEWEGKNVIALSAVTQNFAFQHQPSVWYCSSDSHEEKITESVYNALVLGIHDFIYKSGLKKAVIGLSGGIDSALTLVLAIEALGKENVMSLVLPSQFTSEQTMEDVRRLLENTGIPCQTISIEQAVQSVNQSFHDAHFTEGVTGENIQARMRGMFIMAYANKTGALMLNTSNKSELATGYGTLYGDMGGGLSVLGDVYKTQVYRLVDYHNQRLQRSIVPESIVTKAPTAELKPNQKDTDTLPEFELLDQILVQYIEMHKSVEEIKVEGANKELIQKVINMVNKAEFKRYQFPPILRISPKSFGVGRRMPVVGKY